MVFIAIILNILLSITLYMDKTRKIKINIFAVMITLFEKGILKQIYKEDIAKIK